jgi:hypothetical protein
MTEKTHPAMIGRFDIGEVAASFPLSATTLLVDRLLQTARRCPRFPRLQAHAAAALLQHKLL